MNRRTFLGFAATAAAGCTVRHPRPASAIEAWRRVALGDVSRLRVERVDPALGRCQYVAQTGTRRIAQPILVARTGERFDALIDNRLPQPTTVHFHGLTLPEAQDGAGFHEIAPGASRRVSFEVRNRSGLYWFHAHPHGFTAEQVYGGLFGLLVVLDEEDAAVDTALALLPANRLALALSDVRVAAGSVRPYAPSPHECLHGWYGNRMLVNGELGSEHRVAPGWVRLQLLNACNARGLLLAFRAGGGDVPFHLLGTDGGLLSAPLALERAFLYPGERIDIVLDASGHSHISAVSLAFDARHQVKGGRLAHVHSARAIYPPLAAETLCSDESSEAIVPDGTELSLFTLRVQGKPANAPALPLRLSSLAEPAEGPVRRMRLDFDERAGFLIGDTPYRSDEIAFSVPRGTREVWQIRNSPISMPHPMHLHGFGFRVLRRQGTFGPARALAQHGRGMLASDLGVKDTVVLWPNETVWLAVDFSLPSAREFAGRQRYMFHCHNLEHEDGMMMRNFAVL